MGCRVTTDEEGKVLVDTELGEGAFLLWDQWHYLENEYHLELSTEFQRQKEASSLGHLQMFA